MADLVHVERLAIAVPGRDESWQRVVDGVALAVASGEAVSVVGESGAGKTLTALALTRLLPEPARIVEGSVVVAGMDMRAASEQDLDRIRGTVVGYVFQEPASALDPLRAVGHHVGEAIRAREDWRNSQVRERTVSLLDEVGFADPNEIVGAFPHQLSGGQRQRVLMAAALGGDPALLVLDEPTSALDTVATAGIVDLIERLRDQHGFASLFISHDLHLVARLSTKINVVLAGETVEAGTCTDVLARPAHPYTWRLVATSHLLGPEAERGGASSRSLAQWTRGAERRCRFAAACPRVFDRCRQSRPALSPIGAGRRVRCFLHHGKEEVGDGDT